jgi:hypothetical protein
VSHASGRGFIDRFATDDAIDYFSVKDDGEIVALKPPAQYIIDELKLDRDGLRKQRMVRIHTTQRIREVIEWLEEIRVALMNPSLPTEEVQNLSDLRARFVRFLDGWRVDYDYLFRRIRF